MNYQYEWESVTLSCQAGKSQFNKLGTDLISLGESYRKLDTESASKTDIANAITSIERVNSDLNFEIVGAVLNSTTIAEIRNTNSYNKALLKAALDSE